MLYTLSKHANEKIKERGIPIELIEKVLNEPQQIIPDVFDTYIYQSLLIFENNKAFLLRIIVANRFPPHIITVFKTSNINKYWRKNNEN